MLNLLPPEYAFQDNLFSNYLYAVLFQMYTSGIICSYFAFLAPNVLRTTCLQKNHPVVAEYACDVVYLMKCAAKALWMNVRLACRRSRFKCRLGQSYVVETVPLPTLCNKCEYHGCFICCQTKRYPV